MKRLLLNCILACTTTYGYTQKKPIRYYQAERYQKKLDSLREVNDYKVKPEGDPIELATQLALLYYPELKGHKIKIKYKKNVQYPITASWSFGNVFKFRRGHTYVLLLSENSFVKSVSLNKQVGVIGHEMAHFIYYKKRPSIAMLWWGIKYITSNKFRYRFEKDADKSTIDHGLGYQLLVY
ncbi:MAG: hypothetical protein AAFN93_15545 [Bacteroidota bacterium]